jgi:hypothetical protein
MFRACRARRLALAAAALLGAPAAASASPVVVLQPPLPPVVSPPPEWIADAAIDGYHGNGNGAANTRGDAVIAWPGNQGVWAITRPAGGTWSAPHLVSTASDIPQGVQVAVDDDGDAMVTWLAATVTAMGVVLDPTLRAAAFEGGEWRPAETVASGTGAGTVPMFGALGGAHLALAGDGRAVLAWTISTASEQLVMSSERPPGGSWTPAAVIPTPGLTPWLRAVAIDDADRMTVALDSTWLNTGPVSLVERSPSGTWGSPITLSALAESRFGGLVVTPAGAGVAVVVDPGMHLMLATRSAGGTWSGPQKFARGDDPRITRGPGGVLALLWKEFRAGSPSPLRASIRRGGEWSSPRDLSLDCWGTPVLANAVVDAHGDVLVTWRVQVSGSEGRFAQSVQFAALMADGSFAPTRTLATDSALDGLIPEESGDILALRSSSGSMGSALRLPHERWTSVPGDLAACPVFPERQQRTRDDRFQSRPPVDPPAQEVLTTKMGIAGLRVTRSARRAIAAFSLERAGRVRGRVYRSGRVVRWLAERPMAAGQGRMRIGRLPTGRYRVVLEARDAGVTARAQRSFTVAAPRIAPPR